MALTVPLCCWSATENLKDLIAAAGSSPRTLLLSSGTWVVQDDLKVPNTIHLKLGNGAAISVASGKTLTLHGLLSAPVERIFIGTGNVVFDSNARQRVFPQWWGAKGDGIAEDSDALQASINSFSNKGGEIFIPDGTYVIDFLGIKSNISVIGNSSKAILKQKKGARYCISTNYHNARTNSPMNPHNNIKFSNITFLGTVATDGFSEFMPLLDIRGSRNVYISKCNFIGFRGDGVYIGVTGASDKIYHNSEIIISGCIFDGVNKNNRNGVSIIDCDGIVIEKCKFRNTSRSDMPGAIDFEPDYKYNIIRNIVLSQNSFENIGGNNIIQISINNKLARLDNPIENVEITKNVINGDGKSNGIYIGQPQLADDQATPNNILISDNLVRNTKRSFMVFGVRGVRMVNNIFEECALDPYISYSEKNINVSDMIITGNTFKNLSKENGNGISIFGVKNLEVSDNIFDNIGKADGTSGNALFFRMHGGPAEIVTIVNNTFKGSNIKVPIQRDRGQITFPEHNRIGGNIFQGDNSVFLPANY
jgi:hypothetical protein